MCPFCKVIGYLRLNRAAISFLAFVFYLQPSLPAQDSLTINTSPKQKAALIGSAYNTNKQDFVGGQCLEASTEPTGVSQSSLQLDETLSESRLSNELGLSVGGHARYGAVQANMSADFLSRSLSNSFSVSAIYSAYYILQPEKVVTNSVKYTRAGQNATTGLLWSNTCGNLFVDEITKGAKLFFSVRVDFKSSEDKQKFAAEFSLEGPLAGVHAKLEKATEQFGRDIRVKISATQLGGDVTKLSKIFPGQDDLHFFTDCTLGAFEACAKTIESALKYGREDFPEQLAEKQNAADKSKRGPAVLSYGLSTYESYGLYNGATPPLQRRFELARDELNQRFETAYRQSITAERLLLFPLTPTRKNLIEETFKALKSNLDRMVDAANVCYSTPEKCPAAVDGLELKQINAELLAPDSFATLCEESLSLNAGAPLQVTINSLVDYVDPGGVPADLIDCKIYQSLLARLHRVVLPKKGLSDPTPFVSLVGLERLNINDNQIKDLRPIGELPNLTELIANGNKITNIDVLSRQPLLKYLSLDYNNITDAAVLKDLPLLKDVSLAYNGISDVTPFSNLPRLEYLDLEGTNVADLSPMKTPMRLHCINLKQTLLKEDQIQAFMNIYQTTITSYKKDDTTEAFGNVGEICEGWVRNKPAEETTPPDEETKDATPPEEE
jgi:hypothetical protein